MLLHSPLIQDGRPIRARNDANPVRRHHPGIHIGSGGQGFAQSIYAGSDAGDVCIVLRIVGDGEIYGGKISDVLTGSGGGDVFELQNEDTNSARQDIILDFDIAGDPIDKSGIASLPWAGIPFREISKQGSRLERNDKIKLAEVAAADVSADLSIFA